MAKQKKGLLGSLQPGEAALVLERLIAAHPQLREEAEQIARSVLGAVSFESIADEVEGALRGFDLDDLNQRAGAHSWGYTEPTEAAWEMLAEAVEPFVEDMKRRLKLGHAAEALETCKGILLGLYQIRSEDHDEFLGWAADFPSDQAGVVLADWRSGAKGAAFPRDFVEEYLPEWSWICQKAKRRGTK
jgi:hypothetical protein